VTRAEEAWCCDICRQVYKNSQVGHLR
jgi:hypothetical protein